MSKEGLIIMTMTSADVAKYIVQFANDEIVKSEMKKLGYTIVPNSMDQLIKSFESVGYRVTKVEGNVDSVRDNASVLSPFRDEPIATVTNNKVTTNISTDKPTVFIDENFDKDAVIPFDIAPSQDDNSTTKPNEEIENISNETEKVTTFNHVSPERDEPKNDSEKWLQDFEYHANEANISRGEIAILKNSELLKVEEDTLTFAESENYYTKRLKAEESNMIQRIKELTGTNYKIVYSSK